jgi:uncharacterized protein with PIN domain
MMCPRCDKKLTEVRIEPLPKVIGDEISIPLNNIRVITCPNCEKIIQILYSPEMNGFSI